MPFDLLVLYGLSGGVIAAILVFAHGLSRRYPQDYVRDYFYFLLLSCPLALLGKPLPVLIAGFTRMQGLQADRFYLLFDRLLAKPLWIISLFLLLKCIVALIGKKLSRPFVAGYFIIGGGSLLLAWIFMLQSLPAGRVSAGAQTLGTVHNFVEIFVSIFIYAFGIDRSSRIGDRTLRNGVRTFCWIGLFSKAVFWILILLQFSFTVPFLFGVVLPVPALLYLAVFLKKTSPAPTFAAMDPASLESFYKKFGITLREREIIGLICSGRGNQAIADHLFISIHTVKRHINQIYQKLRVRNRVQLANAVRKSSKTVSEFSKL